VLAGVRADLERAARETEPTLISVDRATGLVNGALDTLLVLIRVAVRIAAWQAVRARLWWSAVGRNSDQRRARRRRRSAPGPVARGRLRRSR
jgi:hypothetical protein